MNCPNTTYSYVNVCYFIKEYPEEEDTNTRLKRANQIVQKHEKKTKEERYKREKKETARKFECNENQMSEQVGGGNRCGTLNTGDTNATEGGTEKSQQREVKDRKQKSLMYKKDHKLQNKTTTKKSSYNYVITMLSILCIYIYIIICS